MDFEIVLFTILCAGCPESFGIGEEGSDCTQTVRGDGHHKKDVGVHVLRLGFKEHVVQAAAQRADGQDKRGEAALPFAQKAGQADGGE